MSNMLSSTQDPGVYISNSLCGGTSTVSDPARLSAKLLITSGELQDRVASRFVAELLCRETSGSLFHATFRHNVLFEHICFQSCHRLNRYPTLGSILTIFPRIHVVANKCALFPTWSELGVVDVLVLERVLVRDFTAEWV